MERLLEERHDGVDVQGDAQSDGQSQRNSQPANDQALSHEHAHDTPGRRTEGPQDCDIGPLVGHDHDEHGHDVKGRHRDDHQQDERHHGLLDLDRAKVVGIVLRPVEQLEAARQFGT